MATEHDYMFFQPEDDSGWSCGPFTIVKVEITVVQFDSRTRAIISSVTKCFFNFFQFW